MITVAEALDLAPIRRGLPEVVAGHANVGRAIRWVHSGEVADIASFLEGGELLMTTGMGIGSSPEDQRRFIAELATRGVTGLVLELGRTFSEPPEALVEEAERHELPLIVLHRSVPFVDITEAIHGEIISSQLALMRRGDEVHRRFTGLVLRGEGVPEILAALADTVGNPVVLEKERQGLMYHARHETADADVLQALEGWRETGGGPGEQAIVAQVPMAGEGTWGRLVVLAMEAPLDEFDRVASERAAEAVALSLLRTHQEERLSSRERGDFLADLAGDRLTETEAGERAHALGLKPGVRNLLAIAVRAAADSPSPSDDAAWSLVRRDVRAQLEASGRALLLGAGSLRGNALILVCIWPAERREALAEAVAHIVHGAAKRHLGSSDSAIVAVGPAGNAWTEIAQSLRDAADASEAARHLPMREWHDASKLALDVLLWKLRDSPELRQFVEHQLGGLIEHDRTRDPKLVATLAAYFAYGGRKAETARAIPLQRQSLYHRLAHVEQILGASLADEATRLGLHLALRAYRFTSSSSDY